MWIFCGGMQRSASTLQYQIASELVEKYGIGKRVTYYTPETHEQVLSSYHGNGYKTFKSHIVTKAIKDQFLANNAVGLYIYRDVRDVISSLKEKNNHDYPDTEAGQIAKGLIDHYYQWTILPNMYITKYEEVILDLKKELYGIANFIGIDLKNEDVSVLCHDLSLNSQKKRIQLFGADKIIFVNKFNVYDSHSLLHTNHIASGKIGRYKDNLSAGQIQTIENATEHWLQRNGYT